MSYISFEKINKFFENQQILKDFDLSIEKESFVTLLGPSGCGKSTLLRVLSGLEPIQSGKIILDGEDITFKKPSARKVGMVFQQYSLFPTMTVYDNIAFGMKKMNLTKKELDNKIKKALEMVDLLGSEKKYPSQLSGGEQQRVAICRCVVTNPKVLLMDEPFSAIDAKLRKALQLRIKEIHKEMKMTTIFVTHDQDEAMTMSDTIHLMNGGVIEQSGTPMELYSMPKTSFVAEFMGNYNKITGLENQDKPCYIRPELVRLNAKENQEGITFDGYINDIILQSGTILYKVKTNLGEIKTSEVFQNTIDKKMGDRVKITIDKTDLISY